jgi:hypothetical protein
VVHIQCARKFKEGHYRWIPAASLQIADILLSETGGFGKALLGEAFFLPYPPEISGAAGGDHPDHDAAERRAVVRRRAIHD